MHYNRFTNAELERRVYIEPLNAEARAELLSRVPDLIDEQDAALIEANARIDELEKETGDVAAKAEEIEGLETEVAVRDTKIAFLESDIYILQDRITESQQSVEELEATVSVHLKEINWLNKQVAKLTFAEDLV